MHGGLFPSSTSEILASSAVLASAINIGGGFTITQRMLDMFKRPTDPPEFNHLYAIPAAATIGTFGVGALLGFPEVTNTAYLAARCVVGFVWWVCESFGVGCVVGLRGFCVGMYRWVHTSSMIFPPYNLCNIHTRIIFPISHMPPPPLSFPTVVCALAPLHA